MSPRRYPEQRASMQDHRRRADRYVVALCVAAYPFVIWIASRAAS